MEAGRELDELIAQKVMGMVPCDQWETFNFGSAGGPALAKRCDHPSDTCYPTTVLSSVAGPVGGCPAFSRDVEAAWRVWGRLRSSGRWCCLDIKSDFDFVYRIELTPYGPGTAGEHVPSVVVDGVEEAPLAICLAALKAVEWLDQHTHLWLQ